jgi:hypothetical protein
MNLRFLAKPAFTVPVYSLPEIVLLRTFPEKKIPHRLRHLPRFAPLTLEPRGGWEGSASHSG